MRISHSHLAHVHVHIIVNIASTSILYMSTPLNLDIHKVHLVRVSVRVLFCHSTCTCILDLSNFLCIVEMCTSHLACVLSHMPTCTYASRTYPSARSHAIMTMLLVFVRCTYRSRRTRILLVHSVSFVHVRGSLPPVTSTCMSQISAT